MNNENKAILKAKIIKNESKFLRKLEDYIDGLYSLFYLILKNPLENFWWECISITIQYSQLLVFIIDKTVSLLFFIKIIV